jgi:hypothetical protein
MTRDVEVVDLQELARLGDRRYRSCPASFVYMLEEVLEA